VRSAAAPAKINLALVVGPRGPHGKHEVETVLQKIDLADDVMLAPGDDLVVEGYAGDTIVARALRTLAAAARVQPSWHVHIEKRIPVAAGLGGGSADAAAALALANATLDFPLSPEALHRVAADVGVDIPFFLGSGAQVGRGDGTELEPVDVPTDYTIVVLLPRGVSKESTASVYRAFDERDGARGFASRRAALRAALDAVTAAPDLARLPLNDLASSPLTAAFRDLGAFRADVSGAGPAIYGLFVELADAERSAVALARSGRVWLARPIA
jgi:4-diphosphocytidyl-2-C-methyl-D-erythritol kinase